MNDSYRNNEIEYCSRVIYCFKTKHKFKNNSRFSQSQDTTLYYNYILSYDNLTLNGGYGYHLPVLNEIAMYISGTWMAFTKIDHFILQFFCLFWTKIFPFPCTMVKFGSIYYAGNMLIRHLCEHDTDILFTSAFKMAELYRFIQICPHVTSKKSIVFSPLLFLGGQSINQSIHMNIFFALRMFWELRYRPYCFVIHHR